MIRWSTTRPSALRRRCGRLALALVGAVLALSACATNRVENPVTGKLQQIRLTTQEEIAIGWRAAPRMAAMHGGLYPDPELQAQLDEIGRRLVTRSAAAVAEYPFEFHLLDESKTINAYALPGGQIFVTYALLAELETEDAIAAVLAHEIGHVLARHTAERMAEPLPTLDRTAVIVSASHAPTGPVSGASVQKLPLTDHLVSIQYSQDDELEADRLAVRCLAEAGYDPRALIRVMETLARIASQERWPEFLDTHPSPENRMGRIYEAIAAEHPGGLADMRVK